MMNGLTTRIHVPPGGAPPTTPLPAPGEHPPSTPNASTTATTPARRRAEAHPPNPYATDFRFHTPSNFATERCATDGIRCATLNVRSIPGQAKGADVYNVLQAWELDVLALQETWLRRGEAEHLATSIYHASAGARTYSTTAPDDHSRHLGVTLILGEQLALHHQHTDVHVGTAIRVILRWRRRELHIIATYAPPVRSTSA